MCDKKREGEKRMSLKAPDSFTKKNTPTHAKRISNKSNVEANKMIADAVNFDQIIEDMKVLPTDDKGNVLIDMNDAKQRDWYKDK